LNHNDLATIDQTNYQIHYQQNQLGLAHAKRQTSGQWSIPPFSHKPQQASLEHSKSVCLVLNLHSTQSFFTDTFHMA
jgi:multidrug resistance efflux pump